MPPDTAGPPFVDRFLATAEAVAKARPDGGPRDGS